MFRVSARGRAYLSASQAQDGVFLCARCRTWIAAREKAPRAVGMPPPISSSPAPADRTPLVSSLTCPEAPTGALRSTESVRPRQRGSQYVCVNQDTHTCMHKTDEYIPLPPRLPALLLKGRDPPLPLPHSPAPAFEEIGVDAGEEAGDMLSTRPTLPPTSCPPPVSVSCWSSSDQILAVIAGTGKRARASSPLSCDTAPHAPRS